ncbi:hypothetical protein AB0C40_00810 [Streptomyces brevispora]|uniref:hypothetical protein n=1 Tax=Streptomyces brevispora TaxID=887462 RepID=UPI0033E203E5
MGERSDLEALEAAIDGYEPPPVEWTDDLWALYERTETEPYLPLTQEQRRLFEEEHVRERRMAEAQRLFESLNSRLEETGLREPVRAADLAERWVRMNLYALPGTRLLYELGVPHGEAALLRLVADEAVDRADRAVVRSWLITLRTPRNRALGRRPQLGETPLFPPAVHGLADAWRAGTEAPSEVAVNRENIAAVRAALEALLPPRRPAAPEPPPEPTGAREGDEDGEERPDWIDVRIVLRALVPYPRSVTLERMAEARREAELMGLETEIGDFAERWTTRVGAWLAGWMFRWLCPARRDHPDLTSWAVDLAEQYVRRGFAAEEGLRFLHLSDEDPRSLAALERLKESGRT